MNPALSLYLDALRLTAALLVLVSHLGHGHLVGGRFWRFTYVGNEAVMLFFVLSGFVIAFVSDGREHSLTDYSASRLSRLYSVVLPALLLTVLLDAVGNAFGMPAAVFVDAQNCNYGEAVGYLLSLLMLSQSWGFNCYPGSNLAYWSMPYEFWYYALFGAWVFLTGAVRCLGLAAAALLAGPQVLSLLPVWLCGVVAYHWQRRFNPTANRRASVMVAVLSGAGAVTMLAVAFLRPSGMKDSAWSSGSWPWQLAFGMLVACHLAMVSRFRLSPHALQSRLAKAVRFAAGCSFSLYLIHMPLLHLLHSLRLPAGPLRTFLMIGLPLLVAGTFGHWCERQKGIYKRLLMSAAGRGTGLGRRSTR